MAQHTIQALQSELDSLRADNIKLFEKIKFLQSYPGRVSASAVSAPGVPGRERGGPSTPRQGGGAVTCWAAPGHLTPSACWASTRAGETPTVGPW